MTDNTPGAPVVRRSFLMRISTVLGGVGVGLAAGKGTAVIEAKSAGSFQPARHPLDDWMDAPRSKHRMVFDTTTPNGMGAALLYARNFFAATEDGYGLKAPDSAVIIVARHNSTGFGFNDKIWAKYGKSITSVTGFNDPATKQPPAVNLFNTTNPELLNRGVTIDTMVAMGVRFAVCQMATHFLAGELAKATGTKDNDVVYKELTANLIGNAYLVPAGIVAVNRAQERGYTLTTVA